MPFLTKQYKFCAAHRYWNEKWPHDKNYEVFGKDIYIHGHNYILDITIAGPIDIDSGFIINLKELNYIVHDNVIDIMDHSQIEKDIKWFEGMQPSTENMVVFIWEHLYGNIPEPARLHAIRLQETSTIFTEYFGPGE